MPKKRAAKAVKRITMFSYDSLPVRCWFDIKAQELCFRRKFSHRVLRLTLADLYARESGPLLMPIVNSL